MKICQLIIRVVVTGVLFILVAFAVSSCRSAMSPVENVSRDTTYVAKIERDSIYVRDSIFVCTKADTVYHTRVQWKLRDRIVRDTVYKEKCDTTTVVREVEKRLTSWQKAKMEVGGYAIVCSVMLVAIWFAKRLKGL